MVTGIGILLLIHARNFGLPRFVGCKTVLIAVNCANSVACFAGETPLGENWVKVVNVFGHLHARVIGGVRQHVGVVEKKTRSREREIDRSIDFSSASSLAWTGHGSLLEMHLDSVTSVQESLQGVTVHRRWLH